MRNRKPDRVELAGDRVVERRTCDAVESDRKRDHQHDEQREVREAYAPAFRRVGVRCLSSRLELQ